MESSIKIKATIREMNSFFDESKFCAVRYFNQIKKGLFEARVRHSERKNYLNGTYTISELISEFNTMEGAITNEYRKQIS